MIARLIPFVKVIKFDWLSQYHFQGMALLFSQDVHEISRPLPYYLPRGSDQNCLTVIFYRNGDKKVSHKFTFHRYNTLEALNWYIENNTL